MAALNLTLPDPELDSVPLTMDVPIDLQVYAEAPRTAITRNPEETRGSFLEYLFYLVEGNIFYIKSV